MSNPILKRIYIKANAELKSPICISNGDEINSDKDIIKDYNGNPFLPATSIVGAMRAYLAESDAKIVFGSKDTNMSPVIVYDTIIINPGKVSIRDGIGLDENKITITGQKFDYEILENGNMDLQLEVIIRENEKESIIITALKNIMAGIKSGEIRFGHKKNRGFGRVNIRGISMKEYSKDSEEKWYDFNWADMNDVTTDWASINPDKYIKISVPLVLHGGISIRQYSAEPKKADYTHLTSNKQPVIPGTSWNGAIRHRAGEILQELGGDSEWLKPIFGDVSIKEKKAISSKIVFGESVLSDSVAVPVTRNKINRFDNSTIDQALFSEISYFGGKCNLDIMVKKDADANWVLGLIALVIKDIKYGFLAIGGQTAIGRGLFISKGIAPIENEDNYLKEFYKHFNLAIEEGKK